MVPQRVVSHVGSWGGELVGIGHERAVLDDVLGVRQALDTAMAEKVTRSLAGTTNPQLHRLVDQMVEHAAKDQTFAEQDRAFHTELLAGIDNSLVGQLVAASWDVHSAVPPKLALALPGDLTETAQAHRTMLEAAERGDSATIRASVVEHHARVERALAAAVAAAAAARS